MGKITSVYQITSSTSGKVYIGSSTDTSKRWKIHKSQLNAGNHHCLHLQRAWNRYGPDDFIFSIIKEFYDEDKCRAYEQELLQVHTFKDSYNVSSYSCGGYVTRYHPNREEIHKRAGERLRTWMLALSDDERRAVYSRPGNLNGMYGRTHTEEVKKILSERQKGNTYAKGRVMSEDQRRSISDQAKLRTGKKNSFYGKHHTEETKKKLSQANSGKKPKNRRPVTAEGVNYDSVSDAAKDLQVSSALVIYRIKSEKYDYEYTPTEG